MSCGNELIQFITKNNLNAYTTGNKVNDASSLGQPQIKANFLSLAGGSWHIPKSLQHEFYNIIRRMIIAKIPISVVEVRTEIFKYFIDLDIMSGCAITLGTLRKIADIIHNCMKKECVGLQSQTSQLNLTQYGYMAQPRELPNRSCVKTGVHIYYPDLHTNSEQALELRKRLIVCFKCIPEFDMLNWEQVIDDSVYKTSGLRLPHIPKLKKCKCQKINGDCQFGCTFGVINENAVYLPEWSIPGSVEKLKNNLRYSLELTQIRTNSDVVNFHLRDRCLVDSGIDPLKGFDQQSAPSGATNQQLHKVYDSLDNPPNIRKNQTHPSGNRTGDGYRSNVSTQNFYVDDERLLSLEIQVKVENFIRKNFQESYPNISITMIKQVTYKASNRNDVYTKYYVHTGSRYCMNISKEHTSNHIYFIIFLSGRSMKISQRCHCTNTHFNTKELCKTYSSRPVDIKIGSDLYRLLLPPTVKTNPTQYEDYDTAVTNTLNIDITDEKNNMAAIISNLRTLKAARPQEQCLPPLGDPDLENLENLENPGNLEMEGVSTDTTLSKGAPKDVGSGATRGFDFSVIQTKPKPNSLASKLARNK